MSKQYVSIYTNPPKECNFCNCRIVNKFYDAKIPSLSWANLCPECFKGLECSLGTGLGQEYTLNPSTKQFEKTAG